MAKIEITIYKCDICGKEVEDNELCTEHVPCYGEGSYEVTAQVDMCKECSKKIRQVIYDNFAEIIDCYM